jgi:hypothetical protein
MLAVGEAARNMVLASHLRLVVSVARQYQHLGLDTADLIQVYSIVTQYEMCPRFCMSVEGVIQ